MFKDAKVGDKVWSFGEGWGEITDVVTTDTYPIKVSFQDEVETYTYSGSRYEGGMTELFWDEVPIPKKCLERPMPKFHWAYRDKHSNLCVTQLKLTEKEALCNFEDSLVGKVEECQ